MTVPLEDPSYQPEHPPLPGRGIPDVVEKWGPRSQVRWFSRFHDELGAQPPAVWARFYIHSTLHRGPCCDSCYEDGEEWFDPLCCCRGYRESSAGEDG